MGWWYYSRPPEERTVGFELQHIEVGGFLPAGGDSHDYHQLTIFDAVPGDKPVE